MWSTLRSSWEQTSPAPTPEDDLTTRADHNLSSEDRARLAAEAASAKQGDDIVILQVGEVLAIVDVFVITSAPNTRQVATIAEEVEDRIKAAGGGGPLRIEGTDDNRWVLLDFGDVVVHVFLQEVREFYELERLWSDVPQQRWEETA
jgi:ribosome-associated protein